MATLACVLGTRALGRAMTFPGSGARAADLSGVAEHRLVARDGVPVHVLEVPGRADARTVVHFHNNRETAEDQLWLARSLSARGLGVVLVEFRGYGRSSDQDPSEEGLYADAEAALDMLAARGQGPDRVVLFGTSLGTGVAAEMARRGRGARLVLVTPYTSLPDLVTDVVPAVPARALLADHFDTLEKCEQISVPTLVIHGDRDEIVPLWMGERVAERVGGSLLVLPGRKHGDLFADGGDPLLDRIADLAR